MPSFRKLKTDGQVERLFLDDTPRTHWRSRGVGTHRGGSRGAMGNSTLFARGNAAAHRRAVVALSARDRYVARCGTWTHHLPSPSSRHHAGTRPLAQASLFNIHAHLRKTVAFVIPQPAQRRGSQRELTPNRSLGGYALTNPLLIICFSVFRLQNLG